MQRSATLERRLLWFLQRHERALIVVWLAALFGKIPQSKYMTVEIAGLYWHFVDLVWVVLFTIVYLM